jgi:hypothetical protein
MLKLYDVRSKAVHGGRLTQSALFEHIHRVREILRLLLVRFVELKRVPTKVELDEWLLTGPVESSSAGQ